MRLRDIQENFKDTMLDPTCTGAKDFGEIFAQDTGICLENRMKIYRNNVIRGLSDAALSALPMTKKLVGEDFLEQAMRAYVVQNLPTQGDLTRYGQSFPDFIKDYEAAKNIPYLYDFTRLEWAWETAYYAADDISLNSEELSALSEEDMAHINFSLRSSLTLIASKYPLDEIVDFCRNDTPQDLHKLSERGAKLMVFRPALRVEIRKLFDEEYEFLSLLQKGETIYDAATALNESHPDFDLRALLQKHLGIGSFSGFSVKKEAFL